MKLFTHLNFPGNCAQAFQFYEKNIGGKILMLMRQSEAPGAGPKGGGEESGSACTHGAWRNDSDRQRCAAGQVAADAQCLSLPERRLC